MILSFLVGPRKSLSWTNAVNLAMEGELIIGGECARRCGDTRAAEAKNFRIAWTDERAETVERPSGPPPSGWVQPCAAANPAIASRLQSDALVGRVAVLGSLGGTAH